MNGVPQSETWCVTKVLACAGSDFGAGAGIEGGSWARAKMGTWTLWLMKALPQGTSSRGQKCRWGNVWGDGDIENQRNKKGWFAHEPRERCARAQEGGTRLFE